MNLFLGENKLKAKRGKLVNDKDLEKDTLQRPKEINEKSIDPKDVLLDAQKHLKLAADIINSEKVEDEKTKH